MPCGTADHLFKVLITPVPHAPQQAVTANEVVVEGRAEMTDEQGNQQKGPETMRYAWWIAKEIGQFTTPAENDRPRAAQCDHADAAGDHAEDDDVKRDVNAARQAILPSRRSLRWCRFPVKEPPPDNAEYGEQQNGDRRRNMEAQERGLRGRIQSVSGLKTGTEQSQDQDGGKPMDRDRDHAIAVRCAFQHRALLQACLAASPQRGALS